MLRKISRLFVIKTRWEAFLIIYALALGATQRGTHYLTQFPGYGGYLLFFACTGAVFMAGGKILDCLKYEQAAKRASEVSGDGRVNSLPDLVQGEPRTVRRENRRAATIGS